MPALAQTTLQPRKTPVQARSAASVDAILEATLQVLVAVGKEHLTTTRVAERAGVSVGTLYQYFPNKSSLLQATLRRHFDGVAAAILAVCHEQQGETLAGMGAELAERFLAAKLADGKSSVALYAVSSDVEGIEIALEMRLKTQGAVRSMLETASDGPLRDGTALPQHARVLVHLAWTDAAWSCCVASCSTMSAGCHFQSVRDV